MYTMLPEAKEYKKGSGKTKKFNRIGIEVNNAASSLEEMIALLDMKLWNYPEIGVCTSTKEEDGCLILVLKKGLDGFDCENKESSNWITVEYLHPNLADEFLNKLIAYGHKLGVSFFAYVGLNSYNGGYPSIYKEKRMKLPEGSKYVNDFDRLCLSNDESIEYLKQSFRKIVQLGYDGIDFEESEEAFWYCDCDSCKENFSKEANTPEEAKNIANSELLHTLYGVIKKENPNCKIGIRAWRQPPLEKPADVIQEMVSSVPNDVGLFWAPGLYVPDSEFEKWTKAFGKDRIWARDTEIKLEVVPKPRLVSDGCNAVRSLIPHLFNF